MLRWLQRGLGGKTLVWPIASDLEQFAQWLLLREGRPCRQVRRDSLLEYLSWRLAAGYKARSSARFCLGRGGFISICLRKV